jgi:predicted acylesterase/phospholipase RssA
MGKIKVLALDGGGSRAGVLSSALATIYGGNTPGRQIIEEFDFVAGNSGGSIVLAALCCNYTPNKITECYDDLVVLRRMFSPNKWHDDVLRYMLGGYSSEGKLAALRDLFDKNQQPGEKKPSDIMLDEWPTYFNHKVDLIVAAFDYDQERATFFRSNKNSLAKSSTPALDATLVEAVHASTNPPIPYYDEPAEVRGHRFLDGALAGYNNPVLAAVVEALANRPGEADDIRVLSIGTGGSAQPRAIDGAPPPLGKPRAGTGFRTIFTKAVGAIFADPPDVASFHAHMALRQPLPAPGSTVTEGYVVRLCPLVRPEWNATTSQWTLPAGLDAEEFERLIAMPLDSMTQEDVELNVNMRKLWMNDKLPNQPIRMGDHMRCDIGHEKFGDAAAHWKQISV